MIYKTNPFYLHGLDCSAPVFSLDDFVCDGAWHDLDLSAIISKGTSIAVFNVVLRASAAGKVFELRSKKNSNTINMSLATVLIANKDNCRNFMLNCPNDRVFQYRATSGFSALYLTAVSCFADGHCHYTDAGDLAGWDFGLDDFTTDGSWHSLDLSSVIWASAKSILFRVSILDNAVSYIKFADSNEVQISAWLRTSAPNRYKEGDFICNIVTPAAPRIKYWAKNASWQAINLAVKGWWY